MENNIVPKADGHDHTHALVKGAFGMIPVLGPLAAEFFGVTVGTSYQHRLHQWLTELHKTIENLKVDNAAFKEENLKNNKQYISTVLTGAQIAGRTHYEVKLEALKNAVINSVVQEDTDMQQSTFISLIDTLSPLHIKLLKQYHPNGGGTIYESMYNVKNLNIDGQNIDDGLAVSMLLDLEARGLIEKRYHSLSSNDDRNPPRTGFTFRRSKLGQAFYQFITR